MNLKDKFERYQRNSKIVQFSFLMVISNFIFFILMIITLFITKYQFIYIILALCGVIFIVLLIISIIFTKKRKINYSEIKNISNPNSCRIINDQIIDLIPKKYNIIEKNKTFDNFTYYICKNKEENYRFIEAAVKEIDEENAMLTLIDFSTLEVGTIVSVEFILERGLCIIKDNNDNLALQYLKNLDLI